MTHKQRLVTLMLLLLLGGGGGAALAQQDPAPAPGGSASIVDLNLKIGGEQGPKQISTALEIVIVLTLLTFVPALIMSVTSFARILIVLGFVRRAMSIQDLPPSIVIMGLTLFLTLAIMYPVINDAYDNAFVPYRDGEINLVEAGERGGTILKRFLVANTREADIALFVDLAKQPEPQTPEDLSLRVVMPAFVLSELKTAFQMGFVIYLPFLVIDLVIASILLSMGMFMLPPVMISTPFKILLFIMVDGWELVVHSVANSFAIPGL